MKRRRVIQITIFFCVALLAGAVFFIIYRTTQDELKKRIIYIPKVVDDTNEFWSSLIAGAKMAAKDYDVELTIMAPDTETDIDGQNQMILDAVSQKPDAVVISPSSFTETTPYARKVVDQGIKLLLIDSEMDQDIADSIVATDNFEAGEKLGTYMKGFLPEQPKIAFVGHVEGASTAIQREAGIMEGLGEAQHYVENVVFCNSIYQTAYDVTKKLIMEHPEINMVAGFNEYSSLGAARAIKDMGLHKQIAIFGIDNSVAQVQMLEDGTYQGLVIQNPFNMGYLGIEQAVKDISGEKVVKSLDSGSKLVTKKDMYTKENQKLLFPFLGSQATKEEQIQNEE